MINKEMFNMAKNYIQNANYKKALELLIIVSKDDKNDFYVNFELAKVYSELGQINETLKILKNIINTGVITDVYVFDLFFKIYNGNDIDYVNKLIKIIDKQFPNEIQIYLEIAKFFINIDRTRAIFYFEHYVNKNHYENIDVAVLLAKLYLENKDINNAKKVLLRIKNNKNKNYLLELFRVYLLSEQTQEALNIADTLLNTYDDINIVHEVADLYLKEKKYEKFEKILSKYLSYCYEDAKLYFYLSKCYEGIGNIENAMNKLFDILMIKQDIYNPENIVQQILDLNNLQIHIDLLVALEVVIKLEKNQSVKRNYTYFKNSITNKLIDEMQKYILSDNYSYAEELAQKIIKKLPDKKQMIDNILLNEKEILQKKELLESKPRILEITLTNRCNLKCIMCENIKSVPWELAENTKNEIIELMPYLEQVLWLGGEVFLYKHFDELFDIANKHNVKQIISTNALLLNDNIIKKLVDYNVELSISVDGVTKEIYEKIRLGANFDNLIAKINLLNKVKHRVNKYMKKRLCVVIMETNYEQIPDFIDFAHKYEFDYITFTPHEGYYDKDIFFYKRKDLDEKMKEVLNRAKKYNIEVENCMPTQKHMDNLRDKYPENVIMNNIELKKNNKFKFNFFAMATMPEVFPVKRDEREAAAKKIYCYSPWQKLFVGCTGYVKVNCNCAYSLTVGHVSNETLMNIWNSNNMINLRHNLLIKDTYKECSESCKENVLPIEKLRYSY
ncbi:MAG: radical SAM protein [Endomicrobiaceae bacterium]|jgi:MoaA/NifB/PqqE/SkfB family radical SAM enzyme/thioredoxin-like negative regulator of GroEL|nr:radical SAM protein [Endomicrobiaceae bacterium]MDD3729412.1 radical SAM protein [Endomicrobiaceae bacterium]MDD4165438.1 radical SAM protein [Endomicrobiaceae bacterium]